jgi:hypothetical protein
MRFPAIRRLAKRILFSLLALICLFLIAVLGFAARCASVHTQLKPLSKPARQSPTVAEKIRDYARPEENTYLTYPEWYIVWSYQEKADFQEKHLPSQFPYFGAIQQCWGGYCCVYGMTRGRYPFNFGDHVMLAVIGTSFSLEYAIKGFYEKTVGKLSEWLSSHQAVEEDAYAYRVAREYADFVHIRPFYEFSFWKSFKGLWTQTSMWGPHAARKWERKVFLGLDYAVEAFYCWMIEKATHASYGMEPTDTYAWIENAPDGIFAPDSRVREIKVVGPHSFVVTLPRYQEFTTIASQLARRDVHFVEIAGNDEILLTAIAPRGWKYEQNLQGEFLFSTDILTLPDVRRIAVRSPVRSLHTVLNELADVALSLSTCTTIDPKKGHPPDCSRRRPRRPVGIDDHRLPHFTASQPHHLNKIYALPSSMGYLL